MEDKILIDKIEEYWDRQPCNIKHSNKPFLSKAYFDEVEKRKYFCRTPYSGVALEAKLGWHLCVRCEK